MDNIFSRCLCLHPLSSSKDDGLIYFSHPHNEAEHSIVFYLHRETLLHKSMKESESVSRSVCSTLWDPMDCSPPGSSVQGILRQEYWSGQPFPSPGGSSWPRGQTWVSSTAGRFFTISVTREAPTWSISSIKTEAMSDSTPNVVPNPDWVLINTFWIYECLKE